MLLRDAQKQIVPGSYSERHSDPFMRYVSSESRWAMAEFRFGDGAGSAQHDGSNRYRFGKNIDTRSGNLMRSPLHYSTDWRVGVPGIKPRADWTPGTISISNDGSHVDGKAVRFEAPYTATVWNVSVLVHRNLGRDYNGAANFAVGIFADAAGPKPGASVSTESKSFVVTPYKAARIYGCDPWAAGEWFWLHATISAALTAGTNYWLAITNSQAYEIYWAKTPVNQTTATCSDWTGAAWSNGAVEQSPFFQIGYAYLCRPPTDIIEFTGTDNERRLYATNGVHVLYWKENSLWYTARDLTAEVLQLIQFNRRLYVALGLDVDMEYMTGVTAVTAWTTVTNERAICFAIHDSMLWKIGGVSGGTTGRAILNGATDGATWGGYVQVGDPGTAVTAMVSHGGKLYCAKEEGIYEITYPDTYPTSGNPVANLVLDFKSDRCLRPWIVSWQSGLYFPGNSGVFEWKNGILRDIWSDRVDGEVQEVSVTGGAQYGDRSVRNYTAPRKFPKTETVIGGERGFFQRAIGTTRGLILALSSPHLYQGQLWWYNRGWHPLGPIESAADPLTAGYQAEAITALHWESYGAGDGRLWFGFGKDIQYMKLPTFTSDQIQYENSAYEPGWMVELPMFDAGKPGQIKHFYSIEVVSKNLSANPSILVDVMVDADQSDDATWTGGFELTAGPVTEQVLGVVGQNIKIRLRGTYTHSSTIPLVIESVTLKYGVLPDTISTMSLVIDAAANQKIHGGGIDIRTTKTIVNSLTALLEKPTPWALTNPWGASSNVWAINVDPKLTGIGQRAGEMGPPIDAQVYVSLIKMYSASAKAEIINAQLDAPTAGINIISNSTFDADCAGWANDAIGTESTWLATQGKPTLGCLQHTSGAVGGYDRTNVTTVYAGNYNLRFWARVDIDDSSFIIQIYKSGGATHFTDTITLEKANTWYYVQAVATLPADNLIVEFWDPGAMGGQVFLFDSVELAAWG